MGNEIKPDGWVAWHPEGGIMKDDTQNCYNPDGFFVGDYSTCVNLKAYRQEDGWVKRPVKLQFLDEPCEKDTTTTCTTILKNDGKSLLQSLCIKQDGNSIIIEDGGTGEFIALQMEVASLKEQEKKAFEAAREKVLNGHPQIDGYKYKFATFEDYLKNNKETEND